VPVDTFAGLAADTAANIELAQAEHSAMPMSMREWARWPAAVVGA